MKPIHNFKFKNPEAVRLLELERLLIKKKEVPENMGTIKQEALDYEPKQMKNIAELDSVPTDIDILNGKGTDKNGDEFVYKYIELSGEQYRVPGKVLGDLKAILAKKPTLKAFSVTKKGQGIGTQYTVIPLD